MGITSRRRVAEVQVLKKNVKEAGSAGAPDVLKKALEVSNSQVELHPNFAPGELTINALPKGCQVMLLQGSFCLNDMPKKITETYTVMELDNKSTAIQLGENSIVAIIYERSWGDV